MNAINAAATTFNVEWVKYSQSSKVISPQVRQFGTCSCSSQGSHGPLLITYFSFSCNTLFSKDRSVDGSVVEGMYYGNSTRMLGMYSMYRRLDGALYRENDGRLVENICLFLSDHLPSCTWAPRWVRIEVHWMPWVATTT